jgi:hypothetical protein
VGLPIAAGAGFGAGAAAAGKAVDVENAMATVSAGTVKQAMSLFFMEPPPWGLNELNAQKFCK